MMMLSFVFLGLLLLGGVVLVALLVGGGAFLRSQGSNTNPPDEEQTASAREILDRRLARGEISRDEYESIWNQIES
jgi:uncharacterized membrane protein